MALEIALQKTFCLTLGAGIIERLAPTERHRVVHQAAVFNRGMIPLIDEVQTDVLAPVICNRKTKTIGAALLRQMRAVLRVSEIAEVPQFGISRRDLVRSSAAGSAKACSQRQTAREVPGNCLGFLCRIKEGTGHRTSSYFRWLWIV